MPTVQLTSFGRRTWSGTGHRTQALVESLHPQHGWLTRGTIRSCGVQDTTGPGLAGRLIWTLKTDDHVQLEPVAGDYRTAEQALLDATKTLDD